jgi:hypothetical protein
MTALRNILARLRAKHRTAKLEAARAEARQAFEAAVDRGDTRAMSTTYARLRDCTTLALRGAR